MEDIVTKLFMNNVKSTMIESFKNLPDEMKNKEFAETFRELEKYKAKEKELREFCDNELFSPNCDGEEHGKHLFATDILDILDRED